MNLKKLEKVFTSKFVGTGPSSYKNRIYRGAVSQRLRNTDLADCASRDNQFKKGDRAEKPVRIFFLSYRNHTPHPLFPPCFHLPNIIWWRVDIEFIEPFCMRLFPASCNFLLLMSECLPQYLLHDDPQPRFCPQCDRPHPSVHNRVHEICPILGFYAACNGSSTSTFRDNLSVSSSIIEQPKTTWCHLHHDQSPKSCKPKISLKNT